MQHPAAMSSCRSWRRRMSRSCRRRCCCCWTGAVRTQPSFLQHFWCAFSPALTLTRLPPDDPVCMFNHTPPALHSVLKFLQDVFASRETADIFYRTDMMVMIDIAVRQISDLSPGDKVSSTAWSCIVGLWLSTSNLNFFLLTNHVL